MLDFASSILQAAFCQHTFVIVVPLLYQYFASITSIILSGELYKQHFSSSILSVAFTRKNLPA